MSATPVELTRDSSLAEFEGLVQGCLARLYDANGDGSLFERNNGRGISERALVFRFAYYLQRSIGGYFVDCDFNASPQARGKVIIDQHGRKRNRFVDVIVHKRDSELTNNLICFEFKKWNNHSGELHKDENNLRSMTSNYGYLFGFQIVLHRVKTKSKWAVFKRGDVQHGLVSIF